VTASALNHDGSTCAVIDRHTKSALHAGSSVYRLDEELLAALEPSLIVTQELCDVCAVSYDQVSEAVRRMSVDIPVLSLEPSSRRTFSTASSPWGLRQSVRMLPRMW